MRSIGLLDFLKLLIGLFSFSYHLVFIPLSNIAITCFVNVLIITGNSYLFKLLHFVFSCTLLVNVISRSVNHGLRVAPPTAISLCLIL